MLCYFIILNVFVAFCTPVNVGPKYPPTNGEVWPKPQHQVKKNTVLTFDYRQFQIKIVGITCPLLSSVVSRYAHIYAWESQLALRSKINLHTPLQTANAFAILNVVLTAPCENYPHYGMDESYNLTIAEASTLRSASIWGIMRGLQTVLHSFYFSDNSKEIFINETAIVDYPRYSHRGLLLDTGRHYVSMQNILLLLYAMEMNKMNVFHWHIIDDQSFPYQSKKFPELSEHAAFYPTMVYSKADIVLVLKYARERGIRVVPEFDVPGHTLSWAASHPEIVLTYDAKYGKQAALNPILNATYELLGGLFKEVQQLFPDKYLHVGGDEVETNCWASHRTIQAYLKEHDMNITDLYPMFITRLFNLLGSKSQPIVWQEVFANVTSLPSSTPVQIWLDSHNKLNNEKNDKGKKYVNKVLEAGKKVILSSPWYLDHLDLSWVDYYTRTDPWAMVDNKSLAGNILGGEACMWGEMIDDRNLISRVWPRASAVAEVLWSSPPFDVHSNVRNRLEEHTCRMIRHDIAAAPANGRASVSSTLTICNVSVSSTLIILMLCL